MHKLCQLYKIENYRPMAPSYLTDIMPPSVEERTNYQLRTYHNVSQFLTRVESLRRSFFPSTTVAWNSLPIEVRNLPTLGTSKNCLKARIDKTKRPWFTIGERFTNIHYARMRIGCIFLNAHLCHNLHVIEKPNCNCG